MIIKLCGLKTKNNFKDLPKVGVNMVGLNFYSKSPRYVEDNQNMTYLAAQIPKTIKKVGVFVNDSIDEIEWRHASFELDYVQLHGDEDLAYCQAARHVAKVIKVFRVDQDFDFDHTKPFESVASYFLFDTKVEGYGGGGNAFDWSILDRYTGQTNFLLAGGIGPDDVTAIKNIKHPRLAGVDINSKFEQDRANKNMGDVYTFVQAIRES